jgi:hypothetical protein
VDFLAAKKLAPSDLGLLQQYLPLAVVSRCSKHDAYSAALAASTILGRRMVKVEL